MENYSFVPSWYTERCTKKINRLLNILTSLLLLTNLIFVVLLCLNTGKINDVKTKISDMEGNSKLHNSLTVENRKINESLNVFSIFLDSLNNKLQYNHISIKGKIITIELQCQSLDEYYSIVSVIEDSEKYRIKQSSSVDSKIPINKITLDIEVK